MLTALKQLITPTYTRIGNESARPPSEFDAQMARTQRIMLAACVATGMTYFCRMSFTAAGAVSVYLASKSQLSDEAKIGVYVVGGLAMLGGLCLNPTVAKISKTETTQKRQHDFGDLRELAGTGGL